MIPVAYHVLAVHDGKGNTEFFKRRGGGWSSQSFYTCGNEGVAKEFISVLKLLGHRVTVKGRN